jgi:hypothetical protein
VHGASSWSVSGPMMTVFMSPRGESNGNATLLQHPMILDGLFTPSFVSIPPALRGLVQKLDPKAYSRVSLVAAVHLTKFIPTCPPQRP